MNRLMDVLIWLILILPALFAGFGIAAVLLSEQGEKDERVFHGVTCQYYRGIRDRLSGRDSVCVDGLKRAE